MGSLGAGFALIGAAAVLLIVMLGAAAAGVVSAFDVGGSGAAAAAATVGAPWRSGALSMRNLPSTASTFPWGECTWFVAQRHRVTWLGDAADWLTNAAAQGWPTASTPAVGAIVVYDRGGTYDPQAGHVALVVGVTGTSYTVVEMNFVGFGQLDQRTLPWPDAEVQGFIP